MGDVSAISWTQHTWNPWQGCTKIDPGCKFCYMYRDKLRYGQDPRTVVRSQPGTFRMPLRRKWVDGEDVFTCSWSDWLHPDADAWRPEAWEIIRQRPGLRFLVLSKRTDRLAECLPPDWGPGGYPNVMLGASVCDQAGARRAWEILQVPAGAGHFVSAEPLLGPVDLTAIDVSGAYAGPRWFNAHTGGLYASADAARDAGGLRGAVGTVGRRLALVIGGGESGLREEAVRPANPEDARRLRDQCRAFGTWWHWKQWGEWAPLANIEDWVSSAQLARMPVHVFANGLAVYRAGKATTGYLLDGQAHQSMPPWTPPNPAPGLGGAP